MDYYETSISKNMGVRSWLNHLVLRVSLLQRHRTEARVSLDKQKAKVLSSIDISDSSQNEELNDPSAFQASFRKSEFYTPFVLPDTLSLVSSKHQSQVYRNGDKSRCSC
jgi:hypothetical protein